SDRGRGRACERSVRRRPRRGRRARRPAAGRRVELGSRGRRDACRAGGQGGARAAQLARIVDAGSALRRGPPDTRGRRAPARGRGLSVPMTALTAWTSAALSRWVRFVLRFRKCVIVVSLLAAALAAQYASTRLGINTDTANMISAELPWRRDFIEFRAAFPARDRNIADRTSTRLN